MVPAALPTALDVPSQGRAHRRHHAGQCGGTDPGRQGEAEASPAWGVCLAAGRTILGRGTEAGVGVLWEGSEGCSGPPWVTVLSPDRLAVIEQGPCTQGPH